MEKLVEDEWVRVPACPLHHLTADLLASPAEIVKRLGGLLFTESDKMAVLAVVKQAIPSLERRRDCSYEGPGEDICGIVNNSLRNYVVPSNFPGHYEKGMRGQWTHRWGSQAAPT